MSLLCGFDRSSDLLVSFPSALRASGSGVPFGFGINVPRFSRPSIAP